MARKQDAQEGDYCAEEDCERSLIKSKVCKVYKVK
jgi:hypothetical protein